jgi:hypothetical protein
MTLLTHEKVAEPVPNPAYDKWYELDQAIISAIMSSLSPEVLEPPVPRGVEQAQWPLWCLVSG